MEAWLLRGDTKRIDALQKRNPSGMKQARDVLDHLRKGRWPGIGRPTKREDAP
jgi:hypothetical protein